MALKPQYLQYEILEKMTWFQSQVIASGSQNLTDIHVFSEDLVKDLMNCIFGLEFVSQGLNPYTKAIDLEDEANKVSVQVTADNTLSKIRMTAEKFCADNKQEKFDRVIFARIGREKSHNKTDEKFFNCIDFDLEKDVFDIPDLILACRKSDNIQIECLSILNKYLSTFQNAEAFIIEATPPINNVSNGTFEFNVVVKNRAPHNIENIEIKSGCVMRNGETFSLNTCKNGILGGLRPGEQKSIEIGFGHNEALNLTWENGGFSCNEFLLQCVGDNVASTNSRFLIVKNENNWSFSKTG